MRRRDRCAFYRDPQGLHIQAREELLLGRIFADDSNRPVLSIPFSNDTFDFVFAESGPDAWAQNNGPAALAAQSLRASPADRTRRTPF